jgi:flagellar motility protein MotE (MotC chaperone)
VSLAADAPPPGSPWWVYVAGFLVTVLVAYVAARSPVWVEKAKGRIAKPAEPAAAIDKPGAEKATAGESILREWRDATQAELDEAEQEITRLRERMGKLEAELYRRGWDGRTPL